MKIFLLEKWCGIYKLLIVTRAPSSFSLEFTGFPVKGFTAFSIIPDKRIVGESAALLFTAGSAKLLPKGIEGFLEKPFQSGGTLTIQMYLSATSEGDFKSAFGIAVVLLVIVLGINLATKALTKHFDVTRKE